MSGDVIGNKPLTFLEETSSVKSRRKIFEKESVTSPPYTRFGTLPSYSPLTTSSPSETPRIDMNDKIDLTPPCVVHLQS